MAIRRILRRLPLWLCGAGGAVSAIFMGYATLTRSLDSASGSPVLLAGLTLLGAGLALYLAEKLRHPEKSLGWVSLVLLHAGLLASLAGLFLNGLLGEKGFVYVREGDRAAFYVDAAGKERTLPFAIRLEDYRISTYPGTLRARSYDADLVIEDGKKAVPAHLSVNSPVSYRGYDFYQQSHGLTRGIDPKIVGTAGATGAEKPVSVSLREEVRIPGCEVFSVRDFIPGAVFPEEGIRDAGRDGVFNPAFLVQVGEGARAEYRWVLPAAPETEAFGACRIHLEDFRGVEYAVLSMVREPFSLLVYLGFALAVAGCAGLALLFRRKTC